MTAITVNSGSFNPAFLQQPLLRDPTTGLCSQVWLYNEGAPCNGTIGHLKQLNRQHRYIYTHTKSMKLINCSNVIVVLHSLHATPGSGHRLFEPALWLYMYVINRFTCERTALPAHLVCDGLSIDASSPDLIPRTSRTQEARHTRYPPVVHRTYLMIYIVSFRFRILLQHI